MACVRERRVASEVPVRRSRTTGAPMDRRRELRRNRARDPPFVDYCPTRESIAGGDRTGVDIREDGSSLLRWHHERDLRRCRATRTGRGHAEGRLVHRPSIRRTQKGNRRDHPLVCSGRSKPRHAARALSTCGRFSAARWKANRRRARNGRRYRRCRTLRSFGNDPPRRRRAAATARTNAVLERPGTTRLCVHLRALRGIRLPKVWPIRSHEVANTVTQESGGSYEALWILSGGDRYDRLR